MTNKLPNQAEKNGTLANLEEELKSNGVEKVNEMITNILLNVVN